MNADLGLRGLQYHIALTAFFPLYRLLEAPSNIILQDGSTFALDPNTGVYLGVKPTPSL